MTALLQIFIGLTMTLASADVEPITNSCTVMERDQTGALILPAGSSAKWMQKDIFYCNKQFQADVPALYYGDLTVQPTTPIGVTEVMYQVACDMAERADDSRFVCGDAHQADVIPSPYHGELSVEESSIGGHKVLVAHWSDIDDASYTLVYNWYQPHELIYIIYEN